MTAPTYTLLLTLGHNSSALVIGGDTKRPLGYEEERLSKVKSDSAFPKLAIEEIGRHIDLNNVTHILVSHWFDKGYFDPQVATKYWQPRYIVKRLPNASLLDVSDVMTHHDMHAYSALAFTESFVDVTEKWHCLIIDGFGTNQEVLSLYRKSDQADDPELVALVKKAGYGNSLGLLFQYAAEACGMNGINDVYKFLGYRAQVSVDKREELTEHADIFASYLYKQLMHTPCGPQTDPERKSSDLIDYAKLQKARHMFLSYFSQYEGNRAIIGFIIQEILEYVVLRLCRHFNIENLMVSGGCFMNVRLNGILAKQLSRLSVMPLAGDQGAALGAYRCIQGPLSIDFGDLCWGPRRTTNDVYKLPSVEEPELLETYSVYQSFSDTIPFIADLLNTGTIVNIVRNTMEYGPRALCHTSTLAKPTMRNVMFINHCNGRDTIMPMAPAMTYENAVKLFGANNLIKVAGSDRFMICTHTIQPLPLDDRHKAPIGATLADGTELTARPQIVMPAVDANMCKLLERLDDMCVINTSFNGHGSPIIYTSDQAAMLHADWTRRAKTYDEPMEFVTMYFVGE